MKVKGKTYLSIMIVLMLIASMAIVGVPVFSLPETKVYVKMPAEGYLNGTEIGEGNFFLVEVWIENAVDLVQWALSVQVDPNVIEVWMALDGSGTVIKDYVDLLWWPPGDVFPGGTVDKPKGKIIDISHAINAWPQLYNDTYCQENIGMDGPGGFDGSGKLCTLRFKALNETAYSLIRLYDVLLFDGLYYETGTPHYFPPDIAKDGHYNEPGNGTLSINTTPVGGEVFVDGVSWGTAPQSEFVTVGTYTVSFGDVAGYYTPANEVAIVTKDTTTVVTGVYEPLPGWIEGTVTDATTGAPIVGATVTAGASSAVTDGIGEYTIEITPGTYTVTASADGYFPSTEPGVVVTSEGTTTVNFELTFGLADLVGHSAWPEHKHFDISSDQAKDVHHGTAKVVTPVPGNLTLFGYVQSKGTADTTCTVKFTIYTAVGIPIPGFIDIPAENPHIVPIGEKHVFYIHIDPYDLPDVYEDFYKAKFTFEASCWYDSDGDSIVDTQGVKVKSGGFTIVP